MCNLGIQQRDGISGLYRTQNRPIIFQAYLFRWCRRGMCRDVKCIFNSEFLLSSSLRSVIYMKNDIVSDLIWGDMNMIVTTVRRVLYNVWVVKMNIFSICTCNTLVFLGSCVVLFHEIKNSTTNVCHHIFMLTPRM